MYAYFDPASIVLHFTAFSSCCCNAYNTRKESLGYCVFILQGLWNVRVWFARLSINTLAFPCMSSCPTVYSTVLLDMSGRSTSLGFRYFFFLLQRPLPNRNCLATLVGVIWNWSLHLKWLKVKRR